MRNIVESMVVAFGMFSKIPIPKIEWNKKNMRYMFVFFPLIGVLIGGVAFLWFYFCRQFNVAPLMYSGVAFLLPVLITGGIHIDGFVDSCDAICSYGDRQKRLEILSDPHVGAFGMIYLLAYGLVSIGVWSQIYFTKTSVLMFFLPFVLSRTVGALLSKVEKSAKEQGLMVTFKNKEEKDFSVFFLIFWLVLCLGAMCYCNLYYALFQIVSILLFLFVFRRYAHKQFGGFTGDLVGFCIVITEWLSLLGVALGGIFQWF